MVKQKKSKKIAKMLLHVKSKRSLFLMLYM